MAAGGSVALRTSSARLTIWFANYEAQERSQIIRHVRSILRPESQTGWNLFAYKIAFREPRSKSTVPGPGEILITRNRWDRLFGIFALLFIAVGFACWLILGNASYLATPLGLLPLWGLIRHMIPPQGIIERKMSLRSNPDTTRFLLFLLIWALVAIVALLVAEALQSRIAYPDQTRIAGAVVWITILLFRHTAQIDSYPTAKTKPPTSPPKPAPKPASIFKAHEPAARPAHRNQTVPRRLLLPPELFQIELPPLRDRKDDIPALANHFLDLCRAPEHTHQTITPQVLHALHARPWPGNVRELRNAIGHAAVVSRGQPLRPELRRESCHNWHTMSAGLPETPKPLFWMGASRSDLREFPGDVRRVMGFAPRQAQLGARHRDAKVLQGFGGAGVLEIVEDHDGSTFRAVYTVKLAGSVYVLHAFQKKSKKGIKTPTADIEVIHRRLKAAEEHHEERRAEEERKQRRPGHN
jgi:phage-related protein